MMASEISNEIVRLLSERGLTVATAESFTGGGIAAAITAVSGASKVFAYGLVTYSPEAKRSLLKVKAETIERFGVISAQTATEMCEGVLRLSGADYAIATTGLAGPGASEGKAAGLCYIAVGDSSGVDVRELRFDGGRSEVIAAGIETGLRALLTTLTYERLNKHDTII